MPSTVPSWKPLTISWRLRASTTYTTACYTGGAGCAFNIRLYACNPTTGGTYAGSTLSIRLSDPPLVTIPVTGFTTGDTTVGTVHTWSFPDDTPYLASGNYAIAIEVPGMTTTGTTLTSPNNANFDTGSSTITPVGLHVMRCGSSSERCASNCRQAVPRASRGPHPVGCGLVRMLLLLLGTPRMHRAATPDACRCVPPTAGAH